MAMSIFELPQNANDANQNSEKICSGSPINRSNRLTCRTSMEVVGPTCRNKGILVRAESVTPR